MGKLPTRWGHRVVDRAAAGRPPGRRGHLIFAAVMGCCCGFVITPAGWGEEATQRRLPEPIRTNRAVFTIPFRLEEPKSREAAPQRVILAV